MSFEQLKRLRYLSWGRFRGSLYLRKDMITICKYLEGRLMREEPERLAWPRKEPQQLQDVGSVSAQRTPLREAALPHKRPRHPHPS